MPQYASFELHLHSQWSYDALTPVEEYFKFARDRKLRAFALTDHHTMDGYGDMLECAKKYPDVPFVAGAELTVHSPLGTFDLVCLNLPCHETGELVDLFKTYRAWQVACGTAISANLVRLGFDFDDAERMKVLQSYRPQRIIDKQGNTHVRHGTMVETCINRGFCKDLDGYKALTKQYVDVPHYPEYDYVIPIVKRAGGLVFIAHPYGYFHKDDVNRMDALCELFQLDGIECSQSCVPEEITPFYREYCVKHKLLSTGGTDLHTPNYEKFGRHCGEDKRLDEILERVELHHGA
ncbi:MAG: PHP domain-containing protein [Victivallales bacterium]|nr:PHP domain-containing protein [Victivallales bacterium]